jgi:trehalose 6-phosphate synthase/phosphatase
MALSIRIRLHLNSTSRRFRPLVEDSEQGALLTQALHSIKTLSTNPRNTVWIVSGRDQVFPDKHVSHIQELGLSAKHGCFIRKSCFNNGETSEQMDLTWQTEVAAAFQQFAAREPKDPSPNGNE